MANIATRPCLISVSRRLSAKSEVTIILDSSQGCKATCNALPLEHLDVVVLGETQRVPKAQGGLVPDKALKASVSKNLLRNIKSFCMVLLQKDVTSRFMQRAFTTLCLPSAGASLAEPMTGLRLLPLRQGVEARAFHATAKGRVGVVGPVTPG